MQRGRFSKESLNAPSSIPRRQPLNSRRSSSIDCVRRGSYLPPKRRTSSAERFKTPSSAMKQSNAKASPRVSACGMFPQLRGSLVDRKRNVLKDGRQLSDKAYQRQCVTELVQFLGENGFPYSVQPNNLVMNPQKKDYEMIFQFLYNVFDAKYEVRRIEEEAPKLLKALGYPFTLTKSSFLSITRMSWPALLGTLMWLLKLVKSTQAIGVDDFLSENDFDQADTLKVLLNFVLEGYGTGVEDIDNEEEMFASLLTQQDKIDLSTAEINGEIRRVQMETENEKKEQQKMEFLVERNKGIDNDISNYQEFISKMDNHLKQKKENLIDVKKTLEEREIELKQLKESVLEKEKQYKAQGYDGQKAHNLYILNKKNLNEKLEAVRTTFKDEETAFWDLEIELCRLRDEIEAHCQRFNIVWEDFNSATENALNPLGSMTLPAARKLLEEHKSVVPTLLMRPRSTEDVAPALDKIEKHRLEIKERLHSITVIQKQHLSELEMKRSSAAMKKNMGSTVSDQKKRELELKTAELRKLIESMEMEKTNLETKLKVILDDQAKTKSSIEEGRKEIIKQKKENIEKLQKWKKVIDDDDKINKQVSAVLAETIREIQVEKMKAHVAMQDVITII